MYEKILKWEYLQQKYQSDNTNKIIVSQDFEGILTAKIASDNTN